MDNKKKASKNIVLLYILNITQLVLPLITLPYLTRVLSVQSYGVVSYVKSVMMYTTLVIEFGYLLSGTKEVLENKGDKNKLNYVISKITFAKFLLGIVSFMILLLMIIFIDMLRKYFLFTILSFITPFLTILLFDFYFRGIEKMGIITIRYLIMRSIATILTFIFVKNDHQLLLIPLFDIVGSIFAVVWIFFELWKMNISFVRVKLKDIFSSLKESFIYFISNIASTAFGALNTIVVGIYLPTKDVAYWGVIMTMVFAVQTMYSPISDGIYPRMLATKSIKLYVQIILFFVPFLIVGSLITYFGSSIIMGIIGGIKYQPASIYLQQSVPLLIISFFNILSGWPLLGAVNRVREVTVSTIVAAALQVMGLVILIVVNHFTIESLLIVRTVTELVMLLFRLYCAFRSKEFFVY